MALVYPISLTFGQRERERVASRLSICPERGKNMTILFRDTTENPPTVKYPDQGETVLYFPNGRPTPIYIRGDKVTIYTERAHPNIVVFGLDKDPTTIEELLARGVREFTIEPEVGATVLEYSYGEASGKFEVRRKEAKG